MIISLILVYCISSLGASRPLREQNLRGRKPLMAVVDAVAKRALLRRSCITFVIDTHYHQALDLDWRKRFSNVSMYMIVVREDEDFHSQKCQINEILGASRAADCSAYVILNRNGLQVSRLLEYAEKERLINTRGDFLLLHDYQIFNFNMNYIWNRIVNVVFIRHYNSTIRVSGEKVSLEWFDLNTVPFPYPSEGDLEPQYIDTWYRGRFRYKNDLFPDKSKNLLHKSLRIAIFPHIPAITENVQPSDRANADDDSGPFGIEYELMRILSKAMNFEPVIYVSPKLDSEKWGSPGGNGTFSGSFGDAVSGNAAFLLGDLYYTSQHLKLFDLSAPYHTECLTFLTPESLNDNSWKILIMPFKAHMWVCVLSTLIFGGFFFYRLAVCYKKTISPHKEKTIVNNILALKILETGKDRKSSIRSRHLFTELQNSILYAYGTLLSISLPRLPDAWALRVFIGWWWLYSILVAVAYRASMTAILANPMSRITIDTLSQLASSQIAVGGWSEEMKEFFLSSPDSDSQKIGAKFEIIKADDEVIARVATGKFAYYENKYFLRHARAKRRIAEEAQKRNATKHHETRTADRILHLMSECAIHMPISLGLDKNSPLKGRVDLVLRRVTETGLVQKWLSDTMQQTVNAERPQESGSTKGLINLRKLYGALVAVGVGYVVSFIALAGELLHWKYIVQRHPSYDKYHLDVYYKLNK